MEKNRNLQRRKEENYRERKGKQVLKREGPDFIVYSAYWFFTFSFFCLEIPLFCIKDYFAMNALLGEKNLFFNQQSMYSVFWYPLFFEKSVITLIALPLQLIFIFFLAALKICLSFLCEFAFVVYKCQVSVFSLVLFRHNKDLK